MTAAATISQIEFQPSIEQNRASNFYVSFLFLPKPKREAINTVYAFCRYTDDIVDEGEDDEEQKYARLVQWTEQLQSALDGNSKFSLLNQLASVIKKFNLPLQQFFELIRGMEMDLQNLRYQTFNDLEVYCYRVASTVGLICAEIFGYTRPETKQYAIDLGIALQLTNILRDIKQDARRGRIYIPKEDLLFFGYSETDLTNEVYDERFKALMKFECDRAHEYFRKAAHYLVEEDKPLFSAARMMGNIYLQVLNKIERAQYDVFSHHIRLPLLRKLYIVLLLQVRNWFPLSIRRHLPIILPV
jgi:phytoene synthase